MNKAADPNFSDCRALPEVAMPFMNTVHCEELTLVARLLSQLEATAPPEKIDALMNEWLAHTEAHFAREERLMDSYRFPPYPIHQMEHQRALDELNAAHQAWLSSRGNQALQDYIQSTWRPWLQQHVATLDKVAAQFLSQFDIEVTL